MGESQRAIARASGVARETVKKYLRIAEGLGLAANGPPPTEDQVVRLVQVGRVVSAPRTWASPQADRLEPYREQITAWLQQEHLQLTRVQELLGQAPGTKRWSLVASPLREATRCNCPRGCCPGERYGAAPRRSSRWPPEPCSSSRGI
jgi:hypothetical protein